ncbi:hypothetical protein E3O06_12650 [Cryobacterium glaciale]|uniref:PKD domain-containing protein n=1 Tax=Cryobacterium glaciale TaxID=1259145 RepID=A0A4R8USG9_9MICO|nr:hypothetical protein [Cryobacterium glaciale]TFB71215.1 hypothetical protein E3O06_12650 [Cryobacterium glaciale]
MVRFKLLLTFGVLLAIASSVAVNPPSYADEGLCTPASVRAETCPTQAIVVGPSVDLTADTISGSSGTGASSHPRRGRGGSVTTAPPRVCANGDPAKPGIKTIPCGNGSFLPFATNPTPAAPCTVCSPDTIVRISDLQNFPAYPAPTGMEPAGWAIVGLAANFWAQTSAQLGEGLLLGQPAQVMFTPISYHWTYDDGATTSTATGGASWVALGLTEFATTPTSHVYTEKGTFTVVLTVDYRADYSFGDQGWRPVEGIVTVPSTPFTVVAANESAVLVAEDCNANPRGPGC